MGKQLTRLVGTPVDVGVANAEGVELDFARRDHVHDHPAGLGFDLHHDHYARYMCDLFGKGATAQAPGVAGTVYLVPFQALYNLEVDRIITIWSVAAGNVRCAIYQDNGDTPAGGALVVQSGSVAIAVGKLEASPTEAVILSPRLYWLANMCDAAAVAGATGLRNHTNWYVSGTLIGCSFANSVGFGAFDDPCPAVAASSIVRCMGVRGSVP